jgi:hypothetical protein
MPYKRIFYPEQHLLYECMFGNITLDEVSEFYQSQLDLLEQVDSPVHLVVDLRSLEKFPTSLKNISSQLKGVESEHMRWVILIANTSPILKFVVSTLIQIVLGQSRYRVFNTMDEALTFWKGKTQRSPTCAI